MSRGKYLRQSDKQIDVYPAEKRRFPDWRASPTCIHIRPTRTNPRNMHDSSPRKWCFIHPRLPLSPTEIATSCKPTQASLDAYLKTRTRIPDWSNFSFFIRRQRLVPPSAIHFCFSSKGRRLEWTSIDYFYLSGEVRKLKICLQVPGKCKLSGIWINGHFPRRWLLPWEREIV